MSYSALQLIAQSYYLSGIVARSAQTVDGQQITDGLFLLNQLLDWKSVDTSLIPYWKYDKSNFTVVGQESYFLENCLAIESLTFDFSSVRYYINLEDRETYFSSVRANTISTFPVTGTFNRELGGGTLYIYPFPNQVFQLNIMGKYGLTNVDLGTDLSTIYDGSYIEYLRYALAEYICAQNGIMMNPLSEKLFRRIERQLMYVSPPDLVNKKSSVLTNDAGINWGDVWIGQGYRPSRR